MKTIISLIAIGFCLSINAQIITTVAGTGVASYNGDGAQAVNTDISYPWTGIFDASGNMYVVCIGDSRVRKINTSGVVSTIAGTGVSGYSGDGGQATAARLNNPIGIAIDAIGDIYISDDGNNVIRKINASGIISTIAGTGTAGFGGDGGQATAAQLNSQNGITFDASGNLYIADGNNNRIRVINSSGIINTLAGNGAASHAGDGGQATAASLHNPGNVTFDATGNIYISDQDNNCIRMINTSGIISTIAGTGTAGFSGDGGQASAAELNNPAGVILDASGNLYITDIINERIRKVNPLGVIITIAGNGLQGYGGDGGQAIAAELYYPGNVFLDASGNMYIPDQDNNRIRKVTNVVPDTNEIGIPSIISPVFGCNDSTINAQVKLQNYGTNSITSCVINYQIDNNAVQTYSWTGSLTSGQTINVNLPSFTLTAAGSHTLLCYSTHPNNSSTSFQQIQSSVNFYIAYGGSLPVIESFETTSSLPDAMWNISHTSTSGGSDFTISTLGAATGSKCCLLDNINNVPGNNSFLQTVSSYDMTNFIMPALTFKAAYQQRNTTNADKLQIFTSTDCGASWSPRKLITSAVLASLAGGTGTSSYIPTPSEFTTYTVPITAVAGSHDVMFRWEFLADPNGVGNNLYIDDINIVDATTGIAKLSNTGEITIYPNPNTGNFTIETNYTEKQTLQIYDITGKMVLSQLIAGKVDIDASNLTEGIYNINIVSNREVINRRLVIVR